ncbi:MAG: PilZ domain-containing protein [Candidatus Kappaea frigidicola]|nr:PilZ domain-containing protein [Candidatus Kappaea frigidicola]
MFAGINSNRKHKRMMKPITARFRICSDDYTDKPRGWDMITIKNLGEGGLYFHHTDKIDIGIKLEFSIALPHKGTWAKCTARVCRVDSPCKDEKRRMPLYGVAANFTGLDEENYHAIKEAIDIYSVE